MSQETYDQLLQSTQDILRQYYKQVGSAIEAPEKPSYGDVDVLVFGPFDRLYDHSVVPVIEVAQRLAVLLNAKAFIRGTLILNFAVPWPRTSVKESAGKGSGEKYAQIDVHICHDQRSFLLEVFHAAHGDLWNILGTTIRRFGLTVNNKGLYLRIPEIELNDRKKSMVFLTDDPRRILNFLGLDAEKWETRFGSRQEMFEYVAGCRMFWVKDLKEDIQAMD